MDPTHLRGRGRDGADSHSGLLRDRPTLVAVSVVPVALRERQSRAATGPDSGVQRVAVQRLPPRSAPALVVYGTVSSASATMILQVLTGKDNG